MSGSGDLLKQALQESIDNWKNTPRGTPKPVAQSLPVVPNVVPLPVAPRPRVPMQDRIKGAASDLIGTKRMNMEQELHNRLKEKLRNRKG